MRRLLRCSHYTCKALRPGVGGCHRNRTQRFSTTAIDPRRKSGGRQRAKPRTLKLAAILARCCLAPPLVGRRLGLDVDLVAEAQDLNALGEKPRDLIHARNEIDRLQDLLLLLRLDVHERPGKRGERARRSVLLSAAINSRSACGSSLAASIDSRRRFSNRASASGELLAGSGIASARSQEWRARSETEHPHPLHALAVAAGRCRSQIVHRRVFPSMTQTECRGPPAAPTGK